MRAAVLLALLAGCAPKVHADPAEGPSSGYYDVRFDLSGAGVDPAGVTSATLAGIPVLQLSADGSTLVGMVQGSPDPGKADLVLTTAGGSVTLRHAFTYDPPLDPAFARMWALGASLGMGVQGGVPSYHGALHSPSAQVARQLGGWHPLPLLLPDLFPHIGPEDIGPPPACAVPDVPGYVAQAAVQVLGQLSDPNNPGQIDFRLARLDPDLAPANIAVGNSNIGDLVRGPRSDDFGLQFLSHLVYAPDGGLSDTVTTSQVDLVQAGDPTLIMLSDAYGNDVIGAILAGSDIDPSRVTPVQDVSDDLGTLLDDLSATGADVFIADLPPASLLPVTREKRRTLIATARSAAVAAGDDPDAAAQAEAQQVDAAITTIEDEEQQMNDALRAHAAEHDNVWVVPFAEAVSSVQTSGVQVGGETLTVQKLGGMLSTDGVHFSDVGYGWTANVFITTIDQALGTDVPLIDLGTLLPDDPYSPDAYLAAGLDPTRCDPR